MVEADSAGARLRTVVNEERPLQIVGVINAYCALQAQQVGFQALYLSGAGLANASYGLPDLGLTGLCEVLDDARRITSICSLPILVDCDTGWGSLAMIQRAVRQLTQAGVAGMHLEDQVDAKRCGHRPGKRLVSAQTMADRIKAAVDARTDGEFVVMARTDAYAGEGLGAAIDRVGHYVAAGADMIFAEALSDLKQFQRFVEAVSQPVLANMTEFGRTPLYSIDQLRDAGVRIVLYPLSAMRSMGAAALRVYQTIRTEGTQETMVPQMQDRKDLYRTLNYDAFERRIDELLDRQEKQ